MKKLSLIISIIFLSLQMQAQTKHNFTLSKDDFLLDGKPFQIISGEMHPARIPHEYWRNRIQMAKAMGCNTIAAYVFWNYHESEPGQFDFKTGNHNIAAFIQICKEEGMWVLLRPGPYVCAEWDFGGLPTYLLKTPDIKVRCMDTRYMAAVSRYVSRLSKEILPLLCTKGGPILMVQVENEYGSYANDKVYLETLRKMWVDNGINVPFYTADGATSYMLEAGNVKGAAIGLDSGSGDEDFEQAKKMNPDVPSFSSETYPGWLTHWKEKWARTSTESIVKELDYLLKNKKSFNLYVIHGGTNFGFTAGANADGPKSYMPDLTSYDYDAPINEQGQPTAKFFAMRDEIKKYVAYKVPEPPAAIPAIAIAPITMAPYASIWNALPAPVTAPQPKTFEALGQNQGMVLYCTKLIGHKSGTLTITDPHDYALIFLDGKFIDTIYRDGGKWSVKLPKTERKDPVLDILMEGMGHINFAQYIIDPKGITDRVVLNGMTLMNWEMYPLPMDEKFIAKIKSNPTNLHDGVFFKGVFSLNETGDTYFDMSGYKKGNVYVNGHNLGRYWNVGPQFRLYCPASWLKKGANEIIVFDLHQLEAAMVQGVKTLSEP